MDARENLTPLERNRIFNPLGTQGKNLTPPNRNGFLTPLNRNRNFLTPAKRNKILIPYNRNKILIPYNRNRDSETGKGKGKYRKRENLASIDCYSYKRHFPLFEI